MSLAKGICVALALEAAAAAVGYGAYIWWGVASLDPVQAGLLAVIGVVILAWGWLPFCLARLMDSID